MDIWRCLTTKAVYSFLKKSNCPLVRKKWFYVILLPELSSQKEKSQSLLITWLHRSPYFCSPARATRDLLPDPATSAGRGHPLPVLSPEVEIFQIIKMNSKDNACTVLKTSHVNKVLLAQKAHKMWKQGWVIQKEYKETVQHCGDGLGKPQATLGLNLVWMWKATKKGLYKFISSKRKARENTDLLLNKAGHPADTTHGKGQGTQRLFTLVFTSRTCLVYTSWIPLCAFQKSS